MVSEFRLITASFIDPEQAIRAIGALQDHGVPADAISVLSPGNHHADVDAHETPVFTDKDGFVEVQTDDPATPTDFNAASEGRRGSSSTLNTPDSPIAADGERGLTTTTPADAAKGAAKGSVMGLGAGLLAGLVALTIPGIGPVLAAGPLWVALGGTLGATAAGAVAGGVVGYLEDQGVPGETAARHHDALREGSVIVTVHLRSHDNAATLESLLTKYNGALISTV